MVQCSNPCNLSCRKWTCTCKYLWIVLVYILQSLWNRTNNLFHLLLNRILERCLLCITCCRSHSLSPFPTILDQSQYLQTDTSYDNIHKITLCLAGIRLRNRWKLYFLEHPKLSSSHYRIVSSQNETQHSQTLHYSPFWSH